MGHLRTSALSVMARVTNGFSNSVFLQKILFNALRLYRPEIKPMLQNRDVGFLAYCLSRRARSRSQILQDLWVCFELEEKQDGFFVEFGATNGVKNSNTWLLEKELGWRGILAEPNPFWHSDLAANRHVQIEHQCVSRRSGDSVSFITTDDTDPELSAIAADTAMNDHFADLRRKAKSITLTTISLDDLLDRYDAPAVIDYISIDTEGNEFEILSSFDFDRRRFKLISVEQNKDTEHKIQKLLESKHYIRVFTQFSQWDGWYISAEMRQSSRTIFAPDA